MWVAGLVAMRSSRMASLSAARRVARMRCRVVAPVTFSPRSASAAVLSSESRMACT